MILLNNRTPDQGGETNPGTRQGITIEIVDELPVIVQFIDDNQGYQFRLTKGTEHSSWANDYRGILVHEFQNGDVFMVVTQYFADTLILELSPIQLSVPKHFSPPVQVERTGHEFDHMKVKPKYA